LPDLTQEAIEHKDEAVGQVRLSLTLAPCGVMEHMVMQGYVPYGLTEMAIKAAKKIEFKLDFCSTLSTEYSNSKL